MSIYELRLHAQPFEQIKSGLKTIEMRLLDEKRQLYKVGDVLIFKKRPEEVETIKTKIVAMHKFPSFNELYKHFNKIQLGYLQNEVANYKDMEEYYSIQEQQNFGVIGIEIKLI